MLLLNSLQFWWSAVLPLKEERKGGICLSAAPRNHYLLPLKKGSRFDYNQVARYSLFRVHHCQSLFPAAILCQEVHLPVDTNSTELYLPRPLTPFIGRRQELADIANRLAAPDCRLLTLLGPGGIGKTRLAIELAHRWREQGQPAVFVDLQATQSAEHLVLAVADALDPSLAGREDPREALLRYLRDQSHLIVLDNFENVVSGAPLLSEILQAAPTVTLLVTSRVVLNLQEEWLYLAEGLRFPETDDLPPAELAEYDAAQLFRARAERVRPDFTLEAEAPAVARLCRLVEGGPLALELSATWTRTMPVAAIAGSIEDDLTLLSTTLRNVPRKHRSMQAVFQRSWQLLCAEEQAVFQRLSVFQGGFDQAAAEKVAAASLPTLAALGDNSLLRWQPDGRYRIHELLRQWAAEQPGLPEEALDETRDRHARYYTRFLAGRFDDLTGHEQLSALKQIALELDNVRAAWQHAVEQSCLACLEQGAMGLHTYYQYRGRFVEGAEAFRQAVLVVEQQPRSLERDRALAILLVCTGWLEMRFGRVGEATGMEEKALALYRRHELPPPRGQGTDPLTALSLLATTRGDSERALALGHEAWERAENRPEGVDRKNMAFAGYGLTSAHLAGGNYEAAQEMAHQTLALIREDGNSWLMAYLQNQLGQINQALGNLAAAGEYYRSSYDLREALDDPEGMALALNYLGEVALAEKAYEEARKQYRRARALYHQLGDRGGLVRSAHGLGLAALGLGEHETAREQFVQALRVAMKADTPPLTLSLLATIGAFLLEAGARELGLATLAIVAHHPAADQATKERGEKLLVAEGGGRLPAVTIPGWPDPAAFDRAPHLDTVLVTLQARLDDLDEVPAEAQRLHIRAAEQSLVEPLTERELEVLEQIALGLTNREIADRLFIALSTVKSHIKSIYGKMAVSNRVQAVARAQELGLVE